MDDLSEPAAPIRVSRSKQRQAERGSDSLPGAIVSSEKQAPARCQLERQMLHELHAGWRAYLHVIEAALAEGKGADRRLSGGGAGGKSGGVAARRDKRQRAAGPYGRGVPTKEEREKFLD